MGSVRMAPASYLVYLLLSLLAAGLAGCVSLPFYTSANQPLPAIGAPPPTRATLHLHGSDLPGGTFIGVALSGGGSRAANFSAAVLFELGRLGLLPDHVSAISSVSGSSLTAAYYGLNGRRPDRWNPDRLKTLLLTNFEVPWILRWFLPHNMFRYVVTDFDRSNILRGVFDDVLFHGRTFDNMGAHAPKIIINAAALGSVPVAFQFTEERFRELGSRLDTYPVSAAVVASGAFPGAFHPVTLRNYLIRRPEAIYASL
jgi:NTE family protein